MHLRPGHMEWQGRCIECLARRLDGAYGYFVGFCPRCAAARPVGHDGQRVHTAVRPKRLDQQIGGTRSRCRPAWHIILLNSVFWMQWQSKLVVMAVVVLPMKFQLPCNAPYSGACWRIKSPGWLKVVRGGVGPHAICIVSNTPERVGSIARPTDNSSAGVGVVKTTYAWRRIRFSSSDWSPTVSFVFSVAQHTEHQTYVTQRSRGPGLASTVARNGSDWHKSSFTVAPSAISRVQRPTVYIQVCHAISDKLGKVFRSAWMFTALLDNPGHE